MKVCFVGTGSMGRRHIKNLISIAKENSWELCVDVLRHAPASLGADIEPHINKQYFSFEELPNDYDVIFITNPTAKHYDTLNRLLHKSKSFFVEKPVFESTGYDISRFCDNDRIIYVACPLRYTKTLRELKKFINNEKIFSVRVLCSSYLPEWRPGTDYTQSYSAKVELGGGVEIDLIHEWDYIVDMFGFPQSVEYYGMKASELSVDTNDSAIYIAKYPDKLCSLSLDYFGRVSRRQIEICTDDDVILADIVNGKIKGLKSGKEIDTSEERDAYQKRELRHFFDILGGQFENDNDIKRASNVLKLTKGEL